MRTIICLLSVAMLLSVGPSTLMAGTGEESAAQDARARFRRGVQLYNEGSFEAALAEFNKAYQLNPTYRLLYNIAQTQFDLHDYVGSYRNLEQYTKEGGREISEERRAQVAELNRKLEERIGQVDVTCNLDGAEVMVDDITMGVTPLRSAVLVNAGPRRITAIKAGYPAVVRMLTVSGMEKKQLTLEFDLARGVDLSEGGANSSAELGLRKDAKKKPAHLGLITSSALAGGCAIATGVLGLLALQAKNDFDRELKTVPTTQAKIDDARSKMKVYAVATDVLGTATLVSAIVSVYFLITESSDTPKSSPKRSVAVAPTVGGMVLQGVW